MKNRKILVIGGKGKTGRKVVERLNNRSIDVRIGSRTEEPAFDWENPGTWVGALADIDTVYITYQPDLAVPGALNTIKEFTSVAVANGIKKMVILSGRGEKEAQLCEQVVMNAGVDWTVVRCDWFNQNFSESFFLDPILAGQVALPRAETQIPFIDTDDIADVVVESLLHDKHNGKIHELTGPRLLTFKDVVKEISKAIGRDIRFNSISIDEYVEMLRAIEVPENYIWLINYLFTHVLDGRNATITDGVEKVLGRKAKDFSEYVKETALSGVWNPINQGKGEGVKV
ncbi:NmrA family NAD(P)-binding protein [Fulvivirgaceae bacterium BMA10]|uniref:NmrA family NAD(P)-binding protein n=1 Tax=Splendidivirga corallicola TaxID=3051826 RepID=A0ABT8KXJ9_9BACT|nr:NmrA family NAD(P)-binding protein [Fulvivirgaceae bacterium BMA10]